MSRKPENSFIAGVQAHLPPLSELHREKMANPYSSGTADSWYSGKGKGSKDLWVEWKYIEVPVRDDTLIDLVGGKKPPLSHLQQEWLRQRHYEGRNVLVIVGCKAGGVIFERLGWQIPLTAHAFRARMVSRKDIAAFITRSVQGKA